MRLDSCIKLLALSVPMVYVSPSVKGEEYIVKHGDYLSKILYEKNYKPIYGRKGWLLKIASINPEIKARNHFKIYSGMKIILESMGVQDGNEKPMTPVAPVARAEREVEKLDPALSSSAQRPEREEVQLPVSQSSSKQKITPQYTFWKFRSSVSWKSIDTSETTQSRSSKIQVVSSTNVGAGALYAFHMDEGFDVFTSFFLDYARFQEDNSNSLSKKNLFLKNFSFGTDWFETYKVKFSVSDRPYLSSSALQTVDIKTTQVNTLDLSYKKALWSKLSGKIESQVGAIVVLPNKSSAFQNNFSIGYNADLSFKLKDQCFQLGYEFLPLNSSSNKTNVQNIYWNLILGNL